MHASLEVAILPSPNCIWCDADVFRQFVSAYRNHSNAPIIIADPDTTKSVTKILATVFSSAGLSPHRLRLNIFNPHNIGFIAERLEFSFASKFVFFLMVRAF